MTREKTSPDVPTEPDDEVLVQAAKKNRAAFTPLYRRYAERVYRYVFSRVGDAAEAEDLVAQVFVDALVSLPNYRPQGRFAGWLFTLAYRRCADFHRKPKTEPLSEQTPAGGSNDPVEQVIRPETFRHLENLLAERSEEERELLRLHYAAGLVYREMADVLGSSEAAIKMAMSRLIQRMKSQWEVKHEFAER